ncbi:MAG: hypothetical protein ACT4P6_10145 [Gemmatimonadaceae bacterium]
MNTSASEGLGGQPSPPTLQSAPLISVVMVTPRSIQTCRRTIGYLRNQSIRQHIEFIVVAPSRAELELEPNELSGFHSWQVVESAHAVSSTGSATAEGVRAARAAAVVYGEEHSYPQPDWARVLVERHREPYAAVGSAMGNANPQTLTSWAHLFGQFGPVVAPVASGPRTWLAGHHTSYKRDVLLSYGERLGEMLDNECALHIDLRQRGHQLFLSGEAVSNHVNISQPKAYFLLDYLGQRGFAATRYRAADWSLLRRLLFVGASPLIPFVRLTRIVRDIRRAGRAPQLLPRVLFIIIPALLCGAVGEAIGYLAGAGSRTSAEKLPMELDRHAYLHDGDRVMGE